MDYNNSIDKQHYVVNIMAKTFKIFNINDREHSAAIVAEFPIMNDYSYTVFRVASGVRRYAVAYNFGSYYTVEKWFASGSDACIFAENEAMQECIACKLLTRITSIYKLGSGRFNLYLTSRNDKPFLVCFGHPSEGYSRNWFKNREDAISYLEHICSR